MLMLAACKYTPPSLGDDDGGMADAHPDAAACVALTEECLGDTLRVCTVIGEQPNDTACDWGCIDDGTPACRTLQPIGGALTAADLTMSITNGTPITIATATTMDSDTGEMTGGITRDPGEGVVAGIEFIVRGGVGVFRFVALDVQTIAIALAPSIENAASLGAIRISAVVDARGDCGSTNAGPGATRGSSSELANAPGAGGGDSPGVNTSSGDRPGGGGGGHAAVGGGGGDGAGATSPMGGMVFGNAELGMLANAGGAGGGCGGGSNPGGGAGGGGGGAIQLVANRSVVVQTGGINVGGCRGAGGGSDEAGGGGGAGGAILIEAPTIEIAAGAGIAANGGGGGGGDNDGDGTDGQLSIVPASGGGSGANSGGTGGATTLFGLPGDSANLSGGGGGAVGRIRLRTRSGVLVPAGFVSPALDPAANAAASVRAATIQ